MKDKYVVGLGDAIAVSALGEDKRADDTIAQLEEKGLH